MKPCRHTLKTSIIKPCVFSDARGVAAFNQLWVCCWLNSPCSPNSCLMLLATFSSPISVRASISLSQLASLSVFSHLLNIFLQRVLVSSLSASMMFSSFSYFGSSSSSPNSYHLLATLGIT